jgi:hypothetical protein
MTGQREAEGNRPNFSQHLRYLNTTAEEKMKKLAVFALCLAALPAVARTRASRPISHRLRAAQESVSLQITEVSDDPAVAARLIDEYRNGRSDRRGDHTLAVISSSSARAVLIPAAGSVHGGGNTFFRSDITMVNYSDNAQDVAVIWIPNGGTATTFKTTFPGDRPPFTQQDFVGTLLNRSGLGSLMFIPVTSSGAVDTHGAIDVYSRIWTPQPGSSGTVSQPFGGVDPEAIAHEYEAIIMGLRQDPGYRTNVGIVNLSMQPLDFTVDIFPEAAAPGTDITEIHITVQPLSMVQQPITGSYNTPVNLIVSVDSDIDASKLIWSTYASSTDNVTGDGWVSIGAKDLDDEDLTTSAISR